VKKWSCKSDCFIVKFQKSNEINGRFVTNLEPTFKINHCGVKECKKRHTIFRRKILKTAKIQVQDVYSNGCY